MKTLYQSTIANAFIQKIRKKYSLMKTFSCMFFLLIFFSGFTFTQPFDKVPKELYKHWVRSFEEDKEDMIAYRPAWYKFDLYVPRPGFEIQPFGSLVKWDIDDKTPFKIKTNGKWVYSEKNSLKIKLDNQGKEEIELKIISFSNNLLYVKK